MELINKVFELSCLGCKRELVCATNPMTALEIYEDICEITTNKYKKFDNRIEIYPYEIQIHETDIDKLNGYSLFVINEIGGIAHVVAPDIKKAANYYIESLNKDYSETNFNLGYIKSIKEVDQRIIISPIKSFE